MNMAHAFAALQAMNIDLPRMTDDALEQLVYGRGVNSQTLITMHQAATALQTVPLCDTWAEVLVTEAQGALHLKALSGDKEASEYLASLRQH